MPLNENDDDDDRDQEVLQAMLSEAENCSTSCKSIDVVAPSHVGCAIDARTNASHFTSEEINELKQLLMDQRLQLAGRNERGNCDSHLIEPDSDGKATSAAECSRLSRDTFSFLIAARAGSLPFSIGVAVVVTKIGMYSLVLADMIANGSPGNPLGIAVSLEWPVALSQTIAVAGRYCCKLPSPPVQGTMKRFLQSCSRLKSLSFRKMT